MLRIAALAVAACLAVPTLANAQSVGIFVEDPYLDYPNYDYDDGSYSPRVYGYYAERPYVAPNVRIVTPLPDNGCGEYFYWNGEACLDARVVPPDVK